MKVFECKVFYTKQGVGKKCTGYTSLLAHHATVAHVPGRSHRFGFELRAHPAQNQRAARDILTPKIPCGHREQRKGPSRQTVGRPVSPDIFLL